MSKNVSVWEAFDRILLQMAAASPLHQGLVILMCILFGFLGLLFHDDPRWLVSFSARLVTGVAAFYVLINFRALQSQEAVNHECDQVNMSTFGPSKKKESERVTGIVSRIGTASVHGEPYTVLILEGSSRIYKAAANNELLALTEKGDEVSFSHKKSLWLIEGTFKNEALSSSLLGL